MSKGRRKARGKGTEDQLDRKIRGERKRQSETKADAQRDEREREREREREVFLTIKE